VTFRFKINRVVKEKTPFKEDHNGVFNMPPFYLSLPDPRPTKQRGFPPPPHPNARGLKYVGLL